jgi:tetratricopeptide (TPR) repeat protein
VAYVHLGDSIGSPFNISAGDYPGAVVWYRKGADLAVRMGASDPSNRLARFDLGVILMRIGAAESAAGNYDDALRNIARSAPILEPSITGTPLNVSNAHQVALLHEYTARSFRALGRNDAAIAAWRRSLRVCGSVLAFTPKDRACLRQAVVGYGGLASALAANGDATEALQSAAKALSAAAAFGGTGSPAERAYQPRAFAANGEVLSILAKRDPRLWPEASDYYRRAVDAWRASGLHGYPYRVEIAAAEAGRIEAERASRQ